jgi:nucleotide-binding universal stress UspA family protein
MDDDRSLDQIPAQIKEEDWYKRQAVLLSRKWGTRLDEFELPCPLCSGELQFQGARRNPIYEFAEGEPGTINLLNALSMTFVCNRCGYTAEFDAELFNPAYLAQLQGASPDRVAELSVRDYRILLPLSGQEKSDTLLELSSVLAGVHHGEVLVLNVGDVENPMLEEKLHHFKPPAGDPAPVRLLRERGRNVGETIVQVAERLRCELTIAGWRGWTRAEHSIMGEILDSLLIESPSTVTLVHDRGLPEVKHMLIPMTGGSNERAAVSIAADLARGFQAKLHLLYVAPSKEVHPERRGLEHIAETLGLVPNIDELDVERQIVVSDNLVQTTVDEAARYDLLLIGASLQDWRGRLQRGSMALKIVRNASCTGILVSAGHSRLSSWMHRLFT